LTAIVKAFSLGVLGEFSLTSLNQTLGEEAEVDVERYFHVTSPFHKATGKAAKVIQKDVNKEIFEVIHFFIPFIGHSCICL
jgi:hypothetical protein